MQIFFLWICKTQVFLQYETLKKKMGKKFDEN